MSSISKKSTYLDNASSTPIDFRVKQEMLRAMKIYGNSSSFNNMGRQAREEIRRARLSIAQFIGSRSEEVIFTSSGSEANNLAIFGLAKNIGKGEIITTPIEHPSIIESLKILKKGGWKITYLKVNQDGLIDLRDLESKLNPRVVLVSVIYANNEIGTIQPINKISKILRNYRGANKPLLHVDACQAAGYLEMSVNNLGIDMLTLNGSKIYGPRGIGVLYIKKGSPMSSLIVGGGQEYGLRAGTENLQAIVGLAKAISLIKKSDAKKIANLRDYTINNLKGLLSDIKINGPIGENRLANNINISIPDLDSENLLLELDKYHIYASAGSACTARSVEPSHVLRAIKVEPRYINGALRFSLGKQTTKNDINYVLKVLPKVVGDLKKRYNNN